jgi:peptidoglycan/xylan/chitin deacetylase (PgdA/CDA1 family)
LSYESLYALDVKIARTAAALAGLLAAAVAAGGGPAGPAPAASARHAPPRPAAGGHSAERTLLDPAGGPGSPGPATSPTGDPDAARYRLPDFPAAPPAHVVALPDGARAPVLARVPTTDPVAFVTIDDGLVRRPEAIPMLRASGVPVTLFLIGPVAAEGYPYFEALSREGAVVEAHTMTHPELTGTPYAFQRRQICDSADELGRLTGRRPVLFRPPYGSYDATTLRAAHDCGMRAVVVWSETARDGAVFYQTPEHRLHPGDILLMHFRDRFADDFRAALAAIHRSGLTPALLEDYLVPARRLDRVARAAP